MAANIKIASQRKASSSVNSYSPLTIHLFVFPGNFNILESQTTPMNPLRKLLMAVDRNKLIDAGLILLISTLVVIYKINKSA